MPWESRPPQAMANCFRMAGGNIVVHLGFAIWKEAVLLFAFQAVGGGTPTPWRRFWTSHDNAVSEAHDLCADAEEYLCETLGVHLRPVEDLGPDDFLMILQAHLNNELH